MNNQLMPPHRIEWCSGCRRQLRVSPQAVAVRCNACRTVTRFRPNRWNQAYVAVAPGAGGERFYNVVNAAANNNYLNMEDPYSGNYNSNPGPGIYGNNNGYDYYTDVEPLPRPRPRPRPRPGPPPPMTIPADFPPPSGFHGRKRAVLIGVSYNNTNYKLSGSVNDVKRMRSLLVDKLGFPADCVLMLTEEEKNPRRIPTKQNMRLAMKWLVHDCQPGDSLILHYSGHGSRQKDYNGDELDGFDETLCPLDHETEGPIIDDEVNATIVRPLPSGAKLHALIDSCYSGTALDLPFLCRLNKDGFYKWEDQRGPGAGYKGTSGGQAFCISACDDHQTSASTAALSSREVTGAMTSSFIQTVQNEPGLTYGRLISTMHRVIPTLMENNTDLFQEPLLSCSEKFDIHAKKLIL